MNKPASNAPVKWLVLDRDGVINEDSEHYIKSAAEWTPIPGSLEAIARLTQAGWRVCVATNQAGLGRKLFDYDAFGAMNAKLHKLLGERGGRIDALAFAPEHPEQATEMRKPSPGMLKDLARRLGAATENIWFVGDSETDIHAAQAAGMQPVLVLTGNGAQHREYAAALGLPIYNNLSDAVAHLVKDAEACAPRL
jgi:D-glycero-D-manno-heptose 1,7-bisphosphate phosphatase